MPLAFVCAPLCALCAVTEELRGGRSCAPDGAEDPASFERPPPAADAKDVKPLAPPRSRPPRRDPRRGPGAASAAPAPGPALGRSLLSARLVRLVPPPRAPSPWPRRRRRLRRRPRVQQRIRGPACRAAPRLAPAPHTLARRSRGLFCIPGICIGIGLRQHPWFHISHTATAARRAETRERPRRLGRVRVSAAARASANASWRPPRRPRRGGGGDCYCYIAGHERAHVFGERDVPAFAAHAAAARAPAPPVSCHRPSRSACAATAAAMSAQTRRGGWL